MEEKITWYEYNRKIALLACFPGTLWLYSDSGGATKDFVIFSRRMGGVGAWGRGGGDLNKCTFQWIKLAADWRMCHTISLTTCSSIASLHEGIIQWSWRSTLNQWHNMTHYICVISRSTLAKATLCSFLSTIIRADLIVPRWEMMSFETICY